MRTGIPSATYRLQLTPELGFADAAELADYLEALGVSCLYTSPVLAARPGSTHGYDVADPTRLRPELGGDAAFERLCEALSRHDLGLLVDIVPNHMAADPANPWWSDVLRHGQASEYAAFFDLDWNPPSSPMHGRVLLPVLGRPYHQALAAGELSPVLADDGLALRYWERVFPLDPATWPELLRPVLDRLDRAGEGNRELETIVSELEALPPRHPRSRAVRSQWDRVGWPRLHDLLQSSQTVAAALDAELRRLAGRRGDASSFDRLHSLLARQAYRLAYWRSAREKLNYRRFFNISDLVGLRTERPEVFRAVHARVLELVAAGAVTGLRIDHVDGLRDPLAYLQRLRREAHSAHGDLYLVVEKILATDEELPPEWPVHGTTGYDILGAVSSLLVDPAGLVGLTRLADNITGRVGTFADTAYHTRRRIVRDLFPGELRALEHRLAELAERDRWACDVPRRELNRALEEVTACLPVYRTYTRSGLVHGRDRRVVEAAVAQARRRAPTLSAGALGFLRRLLTLDLPQALDQEERSGWCDFVLRWQQVTGPVAAKGVEDTAFFREARLISLAEVGADPGAGALSPAGFHRFVTARLARWPHAMSTTATHDTKRGEDVRARLAVLSEIPEAFADCVARWREWNLPHRIQLERGPAPSPADELILYQSMIGVWPPGDADLPDLSDRLVAFMRKAGREAKERTSWLQPNEAYEGAVERFVRTALAAAGSPFLTDLAAFADRVARYGALNSLTQVTLKLTVPGVPDLYQGSELWDLSLVDPDNRRPVDFTLRRRLLSELTRRRDADQAGLATELLVSWRDGRVKLWLTHRLLQLRRRLPRLFTDGDYRPLEVDGTAARHVVAFARRLDESWILVAVPLLLGRLTDVGEPPLGARVWSDTTLRLPADAPQSWRSVLTGRECSSPELASLLQDFPVAVLTAGGGR